MSWAKRHSVKRILVANRGEIACRIFRSAKKLGLETIAVYSDADISAAHTRMADHAVYIGGAAPKDSYLNIPTLIEVACQYQVDMIHPGYGFLSENAEFATACADKKLCFIGPPPEAIAEMGSKRRAKEIMAQAGVPLVPGYHGEDESDARLIKEAANMGLPLLIKAVSGGGGKGMRVVESEAMVSDAISAARRESLQAFADDRLLLEAYLPTPRHVEVQIFFDQQGQGVYLFDRDCSLQRRYQKVIEEAPAPNLSDELRMAMGEAALAAGKAIGYVGAGTVEFLVDGENFYFMEINTRLQVEHPVTERITGIDLVDWQLRVAVGEPLPLKQEELQCSGHAIEARFYAEDPANQFLPSSGRITCLEWPEQDGLIRIDSGVEQGDQVSSWYDPMLAKVIAWGEHRMKAIENLSSALSSVYQAGVTDNRDYLLALLNLPDFQKGAISTALGEAYSQKAENISLSLLQKRALLTAAALYQYAIKCGSNNGNEASLNSYKRGATLLTLYYQGNEQIITIEKQDDVFTLQLPDGSCQARISWQQESMGLSGFLSIEKEISFCRVIPLPGEKIKVFLPECSAEIGLPGCQWAAQNSSEDHLSAPMNGTVTGVHIQPGQQVAEGKVLMTMEAMKMEHSIRAPKEGVISTIFYSTGDQVCSGAQLVAYQELSNASA